MNTTLLKVAVVAAIALGGGGYIAGGEYGAPVSELFASAESDQECSPAITVAAPAAPGAPAATHAASSGLVNLNTATAAELDALPGVGEKTVAQIIAARPIASVDAVASLPGVRPNNLAKFRNLVTV